MNISTFTTSGNVNYLQIHCILSIHVDVDYKNNLTALLLV